MTLISHLTKTVVKNPYFTTYFIIASIALVVLASFLVSYIKSTKSQIALLTTQKQSAENALEVVQKELKFLKTQDQFVYNKNLQEEIDNIQKTYKKGVDSYEKLLSLKEIDKKTEKFDNLFTDAIVLLSQRNYASSEALLESLNNQIRQQQEKLVSQFVIPQNVPTKNLPPASGYSRQQVKADIGTFLVDIITADLNSTRVIVDTASDSDCRDNCPVLSLSEYASRSNAYGGVNGSYFCPASYPTCAGKANSFDILLMNKNKVYFNSDNNKYSTIPLIYFSGNSAGIRGQSLEWGRDTGVNAVIANQGLLLSKGNIIFGGDGDPKKGSKGGRSFVGNKGSSAYIGVVHNATVAEAAHALKALGLENALNLDDGGSTALWYNGYKVGPGRNIPNAVLFIRK
ncbi:MAG: phosphodiester glycosidase family protein [Patescibacteria group bacterium]